MPPRSTRSKWAAPADRVNAKVDAIIQNLRAEHDDDSNSSGGEDMSGDDYREDDNAKGDGNGEGDDPTGRGRDDAVFKWVFSPLASFSVC